jgi:hypothetical protein
MRTLVFVLVCVLISAATASDQRGIRPRADRTDYSVTSFTHTLAIAATIVSPDQARRIFGHGLERFYLIVEVGFYPKERGEFVVRPSDFTLRLRRSRTLVAVPATNLENAALVDKSLPEIATSKPVAGYLYFPITGQNSMNSAFELDYTGNGAWMSLPL